MSRSVHVLHLAHDSMVRMIAEEIVSVLGPWNDGRMGWPPLPSWHADFRIIRHPDESVGMPSSADAIIVAG